MQTRSEREEYIRLIENGELDIIIGTHSLLGSRVTYDRLGLLIVDEEQVCLLFHLQNSDNYLYYLIFLY